MSEDSKEAVKLVTYEDFIADQISRYNARKENYEKYANNEFARKTIDEISVHYSVTGNGEAGAPGSWGCGNGTCCPTHLVDNTQKEVYWHRFVQYGHLPTFRTRKQMKCNYCDREASEEAFCSDVFIYIGCTRAVGHQYDWEGYPHLPEINHRNPNFHSLVKNGLNCCGGCGYQLELKVKATYLSRRVKGEGILKLDPTVNLNHVYQDQSTLTNVGSVHSIQLANPVLYAMSNSNFILNDIHSNNNDDNINNITFEEKPKQKRRRRRSLYSSVKRKRK